MEHLAGLPDAIEKIARIEEQVTRGNRLLEVVLERQGHVPMNAEEAAAYASVNVRTIHRKTREGLLRPSPGKIRRYTSEELDRAIARGIL